MHQTMVDGKFCNASAQKCYICGATPKIMNNIAEAKAKELDESAFKFGLSTLHVWIRFFECLLHVSYKMDLKKWQARDTQEQRMLEERKKKIQRDFKKEMGLIVDKPKAGGSGTSNDGNTARRFFEDTSLSAKITGVDEIIIKRFGCILNALSSGYELDVNKFDEYCMQTAQMFVNKYPWYHMPATVHKILIHGAQVMSSFFLPIGQLSEEAQEARNKDLKLFREKHTRKTPQETTNEDLLYRLLVSSDPYIS